MLDAFSAHVELIERNNVLGEVVADTVIRAELDSRLTISSDASREVI